MLTETKSRDIIYRQMRKVFGNKPFTKADFAKFFENGNRGGLDMMPVSTMFISHSLGVPSANIRVGVYLL